MSVGFRASWFALWATLLVGSAGCADNVTQVVVSVDAESSWGNDTTSVRVVVRGGAEGDAGLDSPSRDVSLMVGAGESYAFPIDVTVAPLDGDASRRWAVDATALNTVTNVTATVRVRGTYVSGRTLRVALVFENTCAGVTCDSDETCRAGSCVDAGVVTAPVDAGVDAGPSDGGLDSEVSDMGDVGVPAYCPEPDIRVPNPTAGTLDNAGTPPSYPTLLTCLPNHQIGAECAGGMSDTDICFSARAHGGDAYCRTPCTLSPGDGGPPIDDPICSSTVHPDSRCIPVVGFDAEPDRALCSLPCNPFDDVGCPSGLHCAAISDSEIEAFFTDCVELDANPRHNLEPCSIVAGETYPTPAGCAPGYTCGYDSVCSDASGLQGYVCMQICDADDPTPQITCPVGASCYRLVNGTFDDAIGPAFIGRCGT